VTVAFSSGINVATMDTDARPSATFSWVSKSRSLAICSASGSAALATFALASSADSQAVGLLAMILASSLLFAPPSPCLVRCGIALQPHADVKTRARSHRFRTILCFLKQLVLFTHARMQGRNFGLIMLDGVNECFDFLCSLLDS